MPAVNINMYIPAPPIPLWNVKQSYYTDPLTLLPTAARISTTPRNGMTPCTNLSGTVYYIYIAEPPGSAGRKMGYVYIPEGKSIDISNMYVVGNGQWVQWQNINSRFRNLYTTVASGGKVYDVYEFAQLSEDEKWEGIAGFTQFCFKLNDN